MFPFSLPDNQSGGHQGFSVSPATGEAVPQQHHPLPAAQARQPPQEAEHVRVQATQHILLVILLYANMLRIKSPL